ncbi:hypothetical protein [Parasitella parasitica]|uniref:Uncharacterized protein n=1 Tax=Parasitella parasitica TaxID=35722 RepID=A0A0B7NDP2_9FUNG|nr:hypothetical protein [Parasitella parasitica]
MLDLVDINHIHILALQTETAPTVSNEEEVQGRKEPVEVLLVRDCTQDKVSEDIKVMKHRASVEDLPKLKIMDDDTKNISDAYVSVA